MASFPGINHVRDIIDQLLFGLLKRLYLVSLSADVAVEAYNKRVA